MECDRSVRSSHRLAPRTESVSPSVAVDVVALVYSLVLGFASGDRRTLAGLRRAYERATGTSLVASAF